MTEHDELRDWDAAYLLGSLSTDDRRRYERHLADCGACASSVAELAGMPGLLGKLLPVEAEELLDHTPPEAPDLLPKLASHVARRRRRVRRWAVGLSIGAVAAGVAIGAVIGPALLETIEQERTSVAVQLDQVTPSPLAASIRLTEQDWGTLIEMECRYTAGGRYAASAEYAMYVTNDAGDEARIATWTAAPGQTATPSGTTAMAMGQIRFVEVRLVDDGTVLLRGSP